MNPKPNRIQQIDDCLNLPLEDDSVDLVFTSPPYEDARTYGIDFNLKGAEWLDWAVPRFKECLRVCRGLVCWVVQGRTRQYKWSATPAYLMVALDQSGAVLRNPPIYYRSGIPGSGGPDWLRSDYEWCVCATKHRGRLPWSDNTACGSEPKYKPGGDPTHRKKDGSRVRVSGRDHEEACGHGGRTGTLNKDGTITRNGRTYQLTSKKANPGNVVRCSGGHLGHKMAHESEAPFPLALAEFFVRSFCPPEGIVLDPMCGSGTTGHAAVLHSRNYIMYDVRGSQVELAAQRIEDVKESLV